jgi:hypothetical protein
LKTRPVDSTGSMRGMVRGKPLLTASFTGHNLHVLILGVNRTLEMCQ